MSPGQAGLRDANSELRQQTHTYTLSTPGFTSTGRRADGELQAGGPRVRGFWTSGIITPCCLSVCLSCTVRILPATGRIHHPPTVIMAFPPTVSWLQVSPDSDMSIRNIPFGIISTASDPSLRPAVAIGDYVLDLRAFSAGGGFASLPEAAQHLNVFEKSSLNDFAALGRPFHRAVRTYLQAILSVGAPFKAILQDNESLRQDALFPASLVVNHMPLVIRDYTDFYASRNHAYNVGCLFRGPANALQPNYQHIPIAYHGRASSVVVSGTQIRRPWGQIKLPTDDEPIQSPSRRFDIELEMGMFICKGNVLGTPISVSDAEEHVFGYVLLNDWSARDIQSWEYVPLGPFTGKNLGTTISPWVVLADALEPFKIPLAGSNMKPLPYLKETGPSKGLDIHLEVVIISQYHTGPEHWKISNADYWVAETGEEKVVSETNSKELIWSWSQMIAHHTITGCNLNEGDLFGSGTISGSQPGSEGSLLEITKGGKSPIKFASGSQRLFLEDGDCVVIRGWASDQSGSRVGFGQCQGTVLKALERL